DTIPLDSRYVRIGIFYRFYKADCKAREKARSNACFILYIGIPKGNGFQTYVPLAGFGAEPHSKSIGDTAKYEKR
ncbi:MAG: hypothetical protein IKG82_02505, partial [Oscillospiraceae bacterium]|nr:hypothetical protein [Oscillospiraceae bacterium]